MCAPFPKTKQPVPVLWFAYESSFLALGVEQSAAENRRLGLVEIPFLEDFDQGATTWIVTLVAASGGDASLKLKLPGVVVEQYLAGGFGVEPVCLVSRIIRVNGYSGDGGCFAPEVGLLPIR